MMNSFRRIPLTFALAAFLSAVCGLWPRCAAARTDSLRDQLRRIDRMYEAYPLSLDDGPSVAGRETAPDVVRDNPWPARDEAQRESFRNCSYLSLLLTSDQNEKARDFLDKLPREARNSPPVMMLEVELLRRTERLDDAIALCGRIIAQSPNDPAPLILLSKIQAAKQDLKGSIESLEKARAIAPQNREVLDSLEKQYREQLGQSANLKESQLALDNMEKVYRDIIEILPGQRSVPYLVVLSRILERRGEGRAALECMEKVVLYQPQDAENRISLAQYQEKFGTDREAPLKTLRRALVADPAFPDLDQAIAKALVHAGGQTTLEDVYKSVAEEYPGRDDIQLRFAELLLSQSKPDEAIAVLEASLAVHPYNHNVDRYVLLVGAMTRQGRVREAIPYLEKAVKNMFGEQKRLLSGVLVSVYKETDQIDKAVELVQQMIEKDPQDAEMRIALASLYQKKGDTQRAEKIANEVLAGEVRDPNTFYDVGLLKWDLGRLDQAAAHLSRAIDLNPEFADAYNSLGYLFAEQGIKLDQALELVQKAMKINPGKGYITDSLGWVYFKRGEIDKAIEQLRVAARLENGDPTIREHLAEAYLAKGDRNGALTELKNALQLSTDDALSDDIKQRIQTIEQPQ